MRLVGQKARNQMQGDTKEVRGHAWLSVVLCMLVALVASACGSTAGTVRSGRPASSSAAPALGAVIGSWATTWTYNPYYSLPTTVAELADLPLAANIWPSPTTYVPQLATSWSSDGDSFVVHLRPQARWQNGKPFTATDVVDTIYLDGINGAAIWDDITGVHAQGAHTVVFTRRSGTPAALLESDLLGGVTPYPASVWGRFVTPALERADVSYFAQALKDPNTALKSAAYKMLSNTLTQVSKYRPRSLVGDGPYRLLSMNTFEAKFVKWQGFYDASHILVPAIDEYDETSTNQIYPVLYSGQASFSSAVLYMPTVMVHSWLGHPDAHLIIGARGAGEWQILFNDHRYPLDLTKVRQALAFVIPRFKIVKLTYGTYKSHGIAAAVPDGLVPSVADQFLTKKQVASLNSYPVDPTKAAKLLESAGFHKSGGKWMMPNGQPFTLTFVVQSGWTDVVSDMKVATTALIRFGIPSTEDADAGAAVAADQASGSFEVSTCYCAGGNVDPLGDFSGSPMGSAQNYMTSGANQGKRGIGFGPVETVPGLGRVNVPESLSQQAAVTPPTSSRMKELTWDWARFVDQQVPYLEYGYQTNQIAYSTRTYTDWPPARSPVWRVGLGAENAPMELIYGQEQGYIRPR